MSSHVHMRMQARVSICTPVARHHVDMHDEENAYVMQGTPKIHLLS